MVRRIPEDALRAIEEAVRGHPGSLTVRQIADALDDAPPRRTLQYRLKSLVDSRRLIMEGSGRWARYSVPRYRMATTYAAIAREGSPGNSVGVPLSEAGADIRAYVAQPVAARTPVGYERSFLDSYRPNETFYLSPAERTRLREIGTPHMAQQPAGTYAKQVLNRLLIDLSWNSSRLEGNTYSLLDTMRLIEAAEEAEGRDQREAQMILNHKSAIEILVDGAEDIDFNRFTVFNLHAALADSLLPDPNAVGRLRRIDVGIGGSVFYPLAVPQLIEECFDRILAKAMPIRDPFEQAFFAMVQLPYLQPFEDVNKRVSRLAANIPLIKGNLSPLSFEDVPRDLYTAAILGVYELNRIELLRDLFVWAYERSAARYGAVRQTLGEPDPFRLRHRTLLRALVAAVIRARMDKRQAAAHVAAQADEHVAAPDRERFRELVEKELLSLHEGSVARYRVTKADFDAWQAAWQA